MDFRVRLFKLVGVLVFILFLLFIINNFVYSLTGLFFCDNKTIKSTKMTAEFGEDFFAKVLEMSNKENVGGHIVVVYKQNGKRFSYLVNLPSLEYSYPYNTLREIYDNKELANQVLHLKRSVLDNSYTITLRKSEVDGDRIWYGGNQNCSTPNRIIKRSMKEFVEDVGLGSEFVDKVRVVHSISLSFF